MAAQADRAHQTLVVVSVEGGAGTIRYIRDCLKRNTPVVLAVGFGRATDALAFAMAHSNAPELTPLEGISVSYEISDFIHKLSKIFYDYLTFRVQLPEYPDDSELYERISCNAGQRSN